jgi:hypothetical protein
MPNSPTTLASSAVETTGTPIPLGYGFIWATGKRAQYNMLQNTGHSSMDYTRVGMWLLAHGEWDGPVELWINDKLAWNGGSGVYGSGGPNFGGPGSVSIPAGFSGQQWQNGLDGGPPFVFNFHSGCDSVIGSGVTNFSSSGPDQGTDVLWAQFPSAVQPLNYSRIAYYTLMRKQPLAYQTNDHQNDPTQWTDINPIGLWRALRCRLFDADGNQTGYAFTTNPAWHIVDVLLRRKLFPDYALDLTNGPDPLPAAVAARFDWETIYTAAQYYDEILANGRRRYEGNYAFSSQTTLQAVLTQMLLVCRSFLTEYAGKIQLFCDAPRPSVFTFDRTHVLPGSFDFDDQQLHTAGNRYVAQMRDLLVPAAAQIASITGGIDANPEVTTVEPHPFAAGDWIVIGGTNTTYDTEWQVATVPAVQNPGTPEEVDPTTFTMVYRGANYPASVGAGGSVGLRDSRFKERAPEFWHKANMLARGQLGVGIPAQRNKVKLSLDFATCTFDQVARIACYERDRALGLDPTGTNGQLTAPYVTPPVGKLRVSMFARDRYGNLACAIRPGDHVTIDPTLDFQYAGEYEVRDPLTIYPPTAETSAGGDSLIVAPAQNSGEIEFTLGPYNEAIMYDTSDQNAAGWLNVPGSDPGNGSNFTGIPLANGGQFVFFTGQQLSGTRFQLPSTGFPAANLLGWASPAGANVKFHSAHTVRQCAMSADRQLTLIYSDDEGHYWSGDVNFAALTWLSPDTTTTTGNGNGDGMEWLALTLLGGEEILWGMGRLNDGETITLPADWASVPASQIFAVAYMHDQPENGNIMFLAGAYVDENLTIHFDVSDDTGHTWHGYAAVLVFAWKNNMGTVTTETLGGASWMEIPLGNGMVFGVGCAKSVADSSTLQLPTAAADGATLEAMVGSSYGQYEAGSDHAQGVGSCYLDAGNIVHISFNNGSGKVWYGKADIFALYCTPASGVPTRVSVSPLSASIAAGAIQRFSATVTGSANQSVSWSVDGIAGGNLTVGTIDAYGNYSAPNAAGQHTITAKSLSDPSASASATVTVYGQQILPQPGAILTDSAGNTIYLNNDVIYVVEA